MADFTFTDRLTWISWRADWRLRYAEASEAVRISKREIASIFRDIRSGALGSQKAENRLYQLFYTLRHQRDAANDLMLELGEAKEHKAALLASKAQELAA